MNTAIQQGFDTRPVVCDLAGAAVPDRVVLVPWGDVKSKSGDFTFDDESARLIVQDVNRQRVDIVLDYEHATLGGQHAAPDGKAPAAGWVKAIWSEPGVGLVGRIEWTPAAAKALAAKEYRYLSPVVFIRKTDSKAVGLHSVALTNKPAIVGMQALVNSVGGSDHGERRRLIMGAAHKWDRDPSIQRVCARESYVDMALGDAALALLSNSERGHLPTSADMNGDRRAVIAKASAEWESLQGQRGMFAGKAPWVDDALREGGFSLLTREEFASL